MVATLLLKELEVSASLNNASPMKNEDLFSMRNGGQTVPGLVSDVKSTSSRVYDLRDDE